MTFTLHQDFNLAHEQDIAWIIALWLRIHGGDPAPEGQIEQGLVEAATVRVISALAETLDITAREQIQHALSPTAARLPEHIDRQISASTETVAARLKESGIQIGKEHIATALNFDDQPGQPSFQAREYCFRFRGEIICTEILSPILRALPGE